MENANKIRNRLDEMYKKDILGCSKINLKVENSSWNRLPAVSSFDLTLNDINELLARVGLERRMANTIKTKGHNNHKMNKYGAYIIRRLRKSLTEGNIERFWHISWFMIRRSVSFRMMSINHISKNWYKNKPLSYVMKIISKTDKIILNSYSDIEYKRVYIPKKAEDALKLAELLKKMKIQETRKLINWRSLGVPQESWRIYLHMISNFLTLFLEDKIMSTQHAYQPGKGTTTAMADVLDRVKRYDNIYEVDFKGCFPSINITGIIEKLLKFGMDENQVRYLEELNLSSPRKPKFEMQDESIENMKREANKWRKEVGDYVWVKKKERDAEGYIIPGGKYTWETKYLPPMTRYSHTGLPQGSPTSPILTILGLDEWTRSAGQDRVFYADDGIIFSNEDIKLKSDNYAGIKIHEGKSGYVKKDGIWIKPLYFVGMLYDGIKDKISGHTRNGSRLDIERESEDLFELLREIKPEYEWNINEVFKRTSLGGVITACLYNGKWGKVYAKDPEPESLFGIKQSWLSLKGRTAHKAQTSSDAVRALAQIIKSKWEKDRKGKLGAKKTEKVAVFRNGRWIHINKIAGPKNVAISIRPSGVYMRLNPQHK